MLTLKEAKIIYSVYNAYLKERDLYNTMISEGFNYNNAYELNQAYNLFKIKLREKGLTYNAWIDILRSEGIL